MSGIDNGENGILPGGEIEVFSDQPWDVPHISDEQFPVFVEKLGELAQRPATLDFKEAREGQAVLARRMTPEERDALWAQLDRPQ